MVDKQKLDHGSKSIFQPMHMPSFVSEEEVLGGPRFTRFVRQDEGYIDRNYELVKVLGEGAFGVVQLRTHKTTG